MKPFKLSLFILGSFILITVCVALSLSFGAREVTISDLIQALIYAKQDTLNEIVIHERLPRTVLGLVAGAALGVSGALMQAITRNPIADPSILGVNTGAALFVVSGIAFFNISTHQEYIVFALLGASLTAVAVYSIGALGMGGATPIKLALAGAAISATLSSITSAILLPRTEVMNAFRFWQVGSISGATWEGILSILPFLLIGLLLGMIVSPSLDALSLGDDVATGLGVNIGTVRLFGAFAGVLLCGAITALTGPIGYVGLMVPHVMRMILGPSLKQIIPFSIVGGAVLLTLSDVLGRLIGSPSELEAGIVTAFIGAPILIYIAMKAKVRAL